jgi:hypothetical protein
MNPYKSMWAGRKIPTFWRNLLLLLEGIRVSRVIKRGYIYRKKRI